MFLAGEVLRTTLDFYFYSGHGQESTNHSQTFIKRDLVAQPSLSLCLLEIRVPEKDLDACDSMCCAL